LGIPYAGKVFRNPRGLSAASLIEQAGLLKSRIGGAEVCDRDPNYMVLHPGASSDDVLKLIENIRQIILEKFNVQLEVEMAIW
jgi:UDP-N-acetylmuramate dehydrogenase